jgi:hypothetical protein
MRALALPALAAAAIACAERSDRGPLLGVRCPDGGTGVVVRGTIEGEEQDLKAGIETSSLGTRSLDADLDDGGALHLEWRGPSSPNSLIEARGTVRLGYDLDVGHCLGDSAFAGGLVLETGSMAGSFTLPDVRRAPYCSGDVVGYLYGCFRIQP